MSSEIQSEITKKESNASEPNTFWDSSWSVTNFLSQCDIFGQPVPAFNIKGKEKVTTAVGGFLSTFILAVTLGYSI